MKRTKIALALSLILIISAIGPVFADANQTPLTRLDFVKTLLDLNNIQVEEYITSSFSDVTEDEDVSFVETATSLGIVSGYDGNFDPEGIVSREQAITMVIKSFIDLDINTRVTPDAIEEYLVFPDSDKVSDWAKAYLTYAIMENIIDLEDQALNPQEAITITDLQELVARAKPVFTREGMTAPEILEKASDNLLELKTLKYNLEMDVISNIVDKTDEENPVEAESAVVMQMDAIMDQENNIVYIVNNIAMGIEDEEIETSSEILMDNYNMYMKLPGEDKWIRQDLDPMMKELEELLGMNMEQSPGISKQQMELFGVKATYLPDQIIDDNEYYVLFTTIDSDSIKETVDEILDKILDLSIDMMGASDEIPSEDEMAAVMKAFISEMIKNMDMEIEYKYFINKESKLIEKMDINQVMYMMMGTIENFAVSTGSFDYYDFNEPVTFPEIKDEDIVSLDDTMAELAL